MVRSPYRSWAHTFFTLCFALYNSNYRGQSIVEVFFLTDFQSFFFFRRAHHWISDDVNSHSLMNLFMRSHNDEYRPDQLVYCSRRNRWEGGQERKADGTSMMGCPMICFASQLSPMLEVKTQNSIVSVFLTDGVTTIWIDDCVGLPSIEWWKGPRLSSVPNCQCVHYCMRARVVRKYIRMYLW